MYKYDTNNIRAVPEQPGYAASHRSTDNNREITVCQAAAVFSNDSTYEDIDELRDSNYQKDIQAISNMRFH